MVESNSISPLSVLVIGTGYLGSSLAEKLTSEGTSCVTADLLLQGKATYAVDVTQMSSVEQLAHQIQKDGILLDCIVYAVSTSGGDEERYQHVYHDGIRHVITSFPGIRIILCSSSALYGITDGGWATETHTCHPLKKVGDILLRAETLVLRAGGTSARLSAIYGPHRCVLVERFLRDGTSLHGSAERWINYIHRDDATSALDLLIRSHDIAGKCFNVTNPSPMKMIDIYHFLATTLERPFPLIQSIETNGRRGGTNQRISCSRLLTLGWTPLYPSFVDGIYNVLEAIDEQ
ncbi:MAG: NAD-dependent epimerase/dehydratase family protein [Akkermansia sp.]